MEMTFYKPKKAINN